MEPPAGIEPATPSLPWIGGRALCYPAFSQVAAHRGCRSYGLSCYTYMPTVSTVIGDVTSARHRHTAPRESPVRLASASVAPRGRRRSVFAPVPRGSARRWGRASTDWMPSGPSTLDGSDSRVPPPPARRREPLVVSCAKPDDLGGCGHGELPSSPYGEAPSHDLLEGERLWVPRSLPSTSASSRDANPGHAGLDSHALSSEIRQVVLDPELVRQAQVARRLLLETQHAAERARADYHHAIRRLHAAGGSLREIAEAFGLSHQRVHQIIDQAAEPRRPWWRRRAQRLPGAKLVLWPLARGVRQADRRAGGVHLRALRGPGDPAVCRRGGRGPGGGADAAGTVGVGGPVSFCGKQARQVAHLVAGGLLVALRRAGGNSR